MGNRERFETQPEYKNGAQQCRNRRVGTSCVEPMRAHGGLGCIFSNFNVQGGAFPV